MYLVPFSLITVIHSCDSVFLASLYTKLLFKFIVEYKVRLYKLPVLVYIVCVIQIFIDIHRYCMFIKTSESKFNKRVQLKWKFVSLKCCICKLPYCSSDFENWLWWRMQNYSRAWYGYIMLIQNVLFPRLVSLHYS